MKNRNLIKKIIVRITAVLLFFAVCSGTMLFSLGYIELPFLGHGDGKTEEQRRLEEYLKGLETGNNISDISNVPSDNGSGTSVPTTGQELTGDDTDFVSEEGTDIPDVPAVPGMTFEDYLEAKYTISYLRYEDGMVIAELELPRDDLNNYTDGNKKTETVRVPLRYEGGYREIESFEERTSERPKIELYMGYIIVDSGIGDATEITYYSVETVSVPETDSEGTVTAEDKTTVTESGIIPSETSAIETSVTEPGADDISVPETTVSPDSSKTPSDESDGEGTEVSPISLPERKTVNNVLTVTIYDSYGKLIGTYPADDVTPAYTRDTSDRPLFINGGKYYYLNDITGGFELSDYDPETDGRGLYFDYAPDFGKSDCSLNKYYTRQDVTVTYDMDSTSYYTRYGVDYKIARELYETDPEFAEQVAVEYRPGIFYNRLFRDALQIAKAKIKAEQATATGTSGTSAVPESSDLFPLTDTSVPADTSTASVPEDPSVSSDNATLPVPPVTDIPPEDTVLADSSAADNSEGSPENASSGTDSANGEVTENAPQISDGTSSSDPADSEIPSPSDTGTDTGLITDSKTETDNPATTAPTPSTKPKKSSSIIVSRVFNAYRFAYGNSRPKTDEKKTTVNEGVYTSYIYQTISWQTAYKYAKAFNFREGRAVTVDDNGIIRVINTSDKSVIYLNRSFRSDASRGGQYTTEFYTEPFDRDVYQLGYFYYDHGLMRLRRCERLSYNINVYDADDDILVDLGGREYHIPDGYSLVSYSEGILLLEREGRYGYYHKDGYWVAQPLFTYAAPFVEGLGVIGFSDGVRGVIDSNGNIVIPFRYSEITNASSGIIACFNEEDGWKLYAKMSK
ncbi:MAG: WG repeat-containing protein [Clostridia bacterium]|nr:WG repeat-containing protein [Clostridia bacterium]